MFYSPLGVLIPLAFIAGGIGLITWLGYRERRRTRPTKIERDASAPEIEFQLRPETNRQKRPPQ